MQGRTVSPTPQDSFSHHRLQDHNTTLKQRGGCFCALKVWEEGNPPPLPSHHQGASPKAGAGPRACLLSAQGHLPAPSVLRLSAPPLREEGTERARAYKDRSPIWNSASLWSSEGSVTVITFNCPMGHRGADTRRSRCIPRHTEILYSFASPWVTAVGYSCPVAHTLRKSCVPSYKLMCACRLA